MSIQVPDPSRDRTGAAEPFANSVTLSVNMHTEVAARLMDYVDRNDITVTEAVRRMFSIGLYIADEERAGRRIVIVNSLTKRGRIPDSATYRVMDFSFGQPRRKRRSRNRKSERD